MNKKLTIATSLLAAILIMNTSHCFANAKKLPPKNQCEVYYSEKADEKYIAGTIIIDNKPVKFTNLVCAHGKNIPTSFTDERYVGIADYSAMTKHIGGHSK